MRVVDKDNNTLDPDKLDLHKGYLKDDKIFVKHHDAQEKVEEVSHYETVRVYPNGGKDVEKVIDTPGQEAKDAYDEYEDVQRYIEYTQAELDAQDKNDAIGVSQSAFNSQVNAATAFLIAQMSTMVDDNSAEQFSGLFDTFKEKQAYPNKTIVRYKTGLYRALTDVPATNETTPDKADGTLFNRIGKPNAKGVYSWLQPATVDQTYTNGDIVVWKDKEWKSDRNFNAYEPGTVGWTEYTE